jgi:23S rRNA (cytosine1962-C5)-methyltransferase
MTFSCSGGVSEELFQKIVTGAALDAKAEVVILKRLHQACDHPVALNFPEAYLKGFLLQEGFNVKVSSGFGIDWSILFP